MSSHPLERLSAFLDHELPDAERRGVEAHLAACPSCARHLRELAAVDALARGIPPAGAPDGYLEALPGRVRRRIRADRPATARAAWVWPLAAGLALAVLAPLVLRQRTAPDSRSADRPAEVLEELAAPVTAAPEARPPAALRPSAATAQNERQRIDSGVAEDEGKLMRPQAASRAPQREAAPAPKARDAFVAPPPAARANESDRGVDVTSTAVAGALADAPPAPASPAEQDALAAAGRHKEERAESAGVLAERSDAAPSLKKMADAPRSAATPLPGREERAFRALAALPLSTAGQARHARGAWLRFVADHPRGARVDEARVRIVEASVAAFRDGADPGDRVRALRDADAYLSQPEAPQAARVQAALRRLDDPR